MLGNKYRRKEDIVVTSISRGRPHHTYRKSVRAIDTYEYELTYGENFHTLSSVIFGTDEYWWALSDMNKPIDAFNMKAGDRVVLPEDIVKDRNGVKKIV